MAINYNWAVRQATPQLAGAGDGVANVRQYVTDFEKTAFERAHLLKKEEIERQQVELQQQVLMAEAASKQAETQRKSFLQSYLLGGAPQTGGVPMPPNMMAQQGGIEQQILPEMNGGFDGRAMFPPPQQPSYNSGGIPLPPQMMDAQQPVAGGINDRLVNYAMVENLLNGNGSGFASLLNAQANSQKLPLEMQKIQSGIAADSAQIANTYAQMQGQDIENIGSANTLWAQDFVRGAIESDYSPSNAGDPRNNAALFAVSPDVYYSLAEENTKNLDNIAPNDPNASAKAEKILSSLASLKKTNFGASRFISDSMDTLNAGLANNNPALARESARILIDKFSKEVALADVGEELKGATSDRDLDIMLSTAPQRKDPEALVRHMFAFAANKKLVSQAFRESANYIEDEITRQKFIRKYGQSMSPLKYIDGNEVFYSDFKESLQSNYGKDLSEFDIMSQWVNM